MKALQLHFGLGRTTQLAKDISSNEPQSHRTRACHASNSSTIGSRVCLCVNPSVAVSSHSEHPCTTHFGARCCQLFQADRTANSPATSGLPSTHATIGVLPLGPLARFGVGDRERRRARVPWAPPGVGHGLCGSRPWLVVAYDSGPLAPLDLFGRDFQPPRSLATKPTPDGDG